MLARFSFAFSSGRFRPYYLRGLYPMIGEFLTDGRSEGSEKVRGVCGRRGASATSFFDVGRRLRALSFYRSRVRWSLAAVVCLRGTAKTRSKVGQEFLARRRASNLGGEFAFVDGYIWLRGQDRSAQPGACAVVEIVGEAGRRKSGWRLWRCARSCRDCLPGSKLSLASGGSAKIGGEKTSTALAGLLPGSVQR